MHPINPQIAIKWCLTILAGKQCFPLRENTAYQEILTFISQEEKHTVSIFKLERIQVSDL